MAEEQQEYEMLTAFCYIALDSLELAAKRVVLMKNMSDAFSRAALDVKSTRLHLKSGDKSSCSKMNVL